MKICPAFYSCAGPPFLPDVEPLAGQVPIVAPDDAVLGQRALRERMLCKIRHPQHPGAGQAEQQHKKSPGQSHRPGKPRQQHRANALQSGRLVQARGDKDCNGRDAGHKDDRGAHEPGGNGGIANDERRYQTD